MKLIDDNDCDSTCNASYLHILAIFYPPVSYLYIMDGEMIIKYKHDFENVHILQRVDYQVNSAVVTVDSKYESHFKSSTLHSTDPFHLP